MLSVSKLVKSFAVPGGRNTVIDTIDFEVREGECYALLGPSGCGKTTTLRCVAGLERADSGVIMIGGEVVSDPARRIHVPVHKRPIGMVFQSYAIWPHLDVYENVAYPLRVQRPRLAKAEIDARVMAVLKLVGMESLAHREATRLSGGQQQRVALARAVVRKPALLLLDEPLSNLDARLRDTMRRELGDLIARIGITAMFVTHDQAEAFALAHRIAVMNRGLIIQEGTPRQIYSRPSSPFVAFFMGSANVIAGRAEGGNRVLIDGTEKYLTAESQFDPGEMLSIVLRPEQLRLAGAPRSGANDLAGQVARLTFQGAHIECDVRIGEDLSLRVPVPPGIELEKDMPVWIEIDSLENSVFRDADAAIKRGTQ